MAAAMLRAMRNHIDEENETDVKILNLFATEFKKGLSHDGATHLLKETKDRETNLDSLLNEFKSDDPTLRIRSSTRTRFYAAVAALRVQLQVNTQHKEQSRESAEPKNKKDKAKGKVKKDKVPRTEQKKLEMKETAVSNVKTVLRLKEITVRNVKLLREGVVFTCTLETFEDFRAWAAEPQQADRSFHATGFEMSMKWV